MKNGFKVFDADAHVVYPADLWERFLDKRYRHRVGRRAPAGLDTYNPVTVDGRWTQHPTSLYGQFQKAINWTTDDMIDKYGEEMVMHGFTGDRVAKALEIEGVDIMVIYGPEYDLWVDGIDPELQAAMVRAYNRWGAGDARELRRPGARVGSRAAATTSRGRSTRSSTRYDHLGARCFWARNNHFNHRNLGDRYYDPIWELLQDLDCRVRHPRVHGAERPVRRRSDRFFSFTEWHTVVHPFEAMSGVVSMITNGVYERFPRLRCAYMEAGCGWLPSWLHRLDEHLELAGAREFPELTMSATDYFRRNCWISTECEDPFVCGRHPLDGRRPHRLRDRLPAPGLEIPPRHRRVPRACCPTRSPKRASARSCGTTRSTSTASRTRTCRRASSTLQQQEPPQRLAREHRAAPSLSGGRLRRDRAALPAAARVLRDGVLRGSGARSSASSWRALQQTCADRVSGAVLRRALGCRGFRPALDQQPRRPRRGCRSTRSTTSARASRPIRPGATTRASPRTWRCANRCGSTCPAARPAQSRPTFYTQWDREVGTLLMARGLYMQGHSARRRRPELLVLRHAQRRLVVR